MSLSVGSSDKLTFSVGELSTPSPQVMFSLISWSLCRILFLERSPPSLPPYLVHSQLFFTEVDSSGGKKKLGRKSLSSTLFGLGIRACTFKLIKGRLAREQAELLDVCDA